ncbi:hypothetical protein PoB_006446900 [Plakobranchus ocellatus]|uniref:Uncharacterized protein n=1 Tax=Plakobranchus ocellatus TaxID=259542 RepID=A0AAV4D1D5_9GAST|nr:hypothetical protein PoB_006446900 [Plakobranchus ocellatus]
MQYPEMVGATSRGKQRNESEGEFRRGLTTCCRILPRYCPGLAANSGTPKGREGHSWPVISLGERFFLERDQEHDDLSRGRQEERKEEKTLCLRNWSS